MNEVDRRRRRAHRNTWVAIGLSGLLLGTAAASAWSWVVAPAFAERGAHCYTAPDPSSRYIETAAANTANGRKIVVADPAENALDICGAAWESGAMGAPKSDVALFVCRDNDGSLQVFPREPGRPSTCRALGTNEPRR